VLNVGTTGHQRLSRSPRQGGLVCGALSVAPAASSYSARPVHRREHSFERYASSTSPLSIRLGWQHQRFSSRTHFSASIDYSSNTRVIQNNTVNRSRHAASLASELHQAVRLGNAQRRRQPPAGVGSGLVSQTYDSEPRAVPINISRPSPGRPVSRSPISRRFTSNSRGGPARGGLDTLSSTTGHDPGLADTVRIGLGTGATVRRDDNINQRQQFDIADSTVPGGAAGAVRPDVQHGHQLATGINLPSLFTGTGSSSRASRS